MTRCKAITLRGKQCTNRAFDAAGYCRTHHLDLSKRPSTGGQFEESVLKVLRLLGYSVQHNVTLAGCQIDILAEYWTGAIPLRLMVECKDYDGEVGVEEIKEFSGALYPARAKGIDKGLLVARSGFTRSAKELADSAGISLVEFGDLANRLIDFDDYIERVIQEFESSPVAKYYIDLSYALTEDYLGGDPDLMQRPLDDAVNRILFQDAKPQPQGIHEQGVSARSISVDQEQVASSDSNPDAEQLQTSKPSFSHSTSKGATVGKAKIALLGNFGTGKTTWCRKYAHDLALQYKQDRTRRIPIVVSLSDYETKLDIQQLITNTLQFRYGIRADLSICQELQRLGRFLFIFDGLDEMATRVDPEVVRENLREINKVARIQENVFIVTCRTHFFRDRVQAEVLGDFEMLFIPEWRETELQEYLQKRFGSEWEKHLDRIHGTHNLAELAQTPLFLEMIVETLPKLGEQVRRSELYETYTNAWVVEQSQRRGARLQSDDRKRFVIELATRLYKDNRVSCHYSEFSEMLRKRFMVQDAGQIDYLQSDVRNCTFLTRNSNGDYEFRHKSFTEYFVAVAIKEQFDVDSAELLRLKPLPVEVKGFLVELLSQDPPHELLTRWHKSEEEAVLRDNAFALAVGLQVQIPTVARAKLDDKTPTDELLLLFLQGNTEAFTQMMHRYFPAVQSRLLTMGLSHVVAREAAYDVFFIILQNRDRISSPKEFVPYLLRTARWKAVDLKRREQRDANRNVSLDELTRGIEFPDGYYNFPANNIPDPNLWPDEQLMHKEYWETHDGQVSEIDAAMSRLSETEQTIIRRSLFEGAKGSEIAKTIGISMSKFYRIRSEAVRRLRTILTAL